MCKKHWVMVPPDAQAKLWRLYRPGQETDKQPSVQYLKHAMQIINDVADKEASG